MKAQKRLLCRIARTGCCPVLTQAEPEFEDVLDALREQPLQTYSGDFAAGCDKLLQAQMQACMDQQTHEALAAQVCGEVPFAWAMTSGTTGDSKHYPITPSYLRLMHDKMQAAGNVWDLQVKKFPLTKPPHLPQDAMGVAGGASSTSAADALQKAAVISSNKLTTCLPQQHYVLSLRLSGHCEELPGGQLVGSFTSVFINRDSRAGRQSDTDGRGQVLTCQPAEFQYLTAQAGCSAGIRYYLLWLCAAAAPGLQLITFISDIFAGNLLTAVTVMQQRWEELVEDLKAGKLLPARRQEVPAAVADLVDSYLAAAAPASMAAEAERLQQIMCQYTAPNSKTIASSNLQTPEAGSCGGSAVNSPSSPNSCESTPQPALLQQLLPNLQAVFVITTGSHSKFCSTLQQLLGPTTAIVTPFYGATEGLYGYNVQLLCPGPWVPLKDPAQQQFALLPDTTCFFEFLPTDDDADNNGSDADVVVVEQGHWASSASAKSLPAQALGLTPRADCKSAQQQHQHQQQHQQQQHQVEDSRHQRGFTCALTMDQLQAGRAYELLVTNVNGLVRFRVGDIIKVHGFMPYDLQTMMMAASATPADQVDPVPVISFIRRAGVALNLVWEKYDEGQLLKAVRETVAAVNETAESSGTLFPGLAEFTVRESIEDEADKHYAFYWELMPTNNGSSHSKLSMSGAPAITDPHTAGTASHSAVPCPSNRMFTASDVAAWQEELNRQLCRINKVYGSLLSAGQIMPATITLVECGSFAALKEATVAAKGISPSQFKMPTVIKTNSKQMQHFEERRLPVPNIVCFGQ